MTATQRDAVRTTAVRPSARSRGRATAPAFELLSAKLTVPVVRPGIVTRAGLVESLASEEARVVSVTAPAGYGKTTLLAQWASRDPRPFAWVSLDRRDNDPVVLLTYVASALDRASPIDGSVFRALTSAGSSIWRQAMPRLAEALASLPRATVLLFDDVHEIEEPDCLDALYELVRSVPGGSTLALAGRAELPSISRHRAGGGLRELGPAELALSDDEAQLLLAEAGIDVELAEAREVNARAEGWAAGLYLAALSRQGAATEAWPEITGVERYVADYLRSEHLSRLGRREAEFLIRTSVLERMSAPLCDAILESRDSARQLASLERRNLFLVPLDPAHEWYRYHHLFRDLLRSELARAHPELVDDQNRRAASWCESNGLPEEAIEYATAAGDLDAVARLLWTVAMPTYRSGRLATLERWLSIFDEAGLRERYPAVCAIGAWTYYGVNGPGNRWATAVENASYDGPMPDGSASTRPWAAVVRTMYSNRGFDAIRVDAELALAELPPASPWRPLMQFHLAVAAMFTGHPGDAELLLRDTVEAAREARGTGLAVMKLERALLALERGDLEQVELLADESRALIDESSVHQWHADAALCAVQAQIGLRRGEVERARAELASAQRLRPEFDGGPPWFSVQILLQLARAHLALADPPGARELLRQAHDWIRQYPDLGTLVQEADELRERLAEFTRPKAGWASTLTAAELRLLPLLTTHLSFREIAERLYVSRNTVKTQAISVYRKLDASSRSEAIARAVELGLVERAAGTPPPDFTRSG